MKRQRRPLDDGNDRQRKRIIAESVHEHHANISSPTAFEAMPGEILGGSDGGIEVTGSLHGNYFCAPCANVRGTVILRPNSSECT